MPSRWPLSRRKRLVDLLGSGVLLGLCALPLGALIVAVKLDSPGPAFFGQQRIGKQGKPFTLWKLRTLPHHPDAANDGFVPGRSLKPTRLGRHLRSTRLNELPQLVHVFLGQMSFVGPRPEVTRYLDVIESHTAEILQLRPGLTDEATLHYLDEEELLARSEDPERLYRETLLPHKLDLASHYLQHAGFITDSTLLLRTFQALLSRLLR